MPTEIQKLMELDYRALFTSVVILMVGWVAIKTLLSKFSEATGLEFPWIKRERERNEQISAIDDRINKIDTRVSSIADSVSNMRSIVENLSSTVTSLEARQDANEAAKLKDRIAEAYRYYHERQAWNTMEKEAFEDLIEAYTQYSSNSFVHTICEPESATWRVIDQD